MTESSVVLKKRVEAADNTLNSFHQNNTRFCHRALFSGNWKHVWLRVIPFRNYDVRGNLQIDVVGFMPFGNILGIDMCSPETL